MNGGVDENEAFALRNYQQQHPHPLPHTLLLLLLLLSTDDVPTTRDSFLCCTYSTHTLFFHPPSADTIVNWSR